MSGMGGMSGMSGMSGMGGQVGVLDRTRQWVCKSDAPIDGERQCTQWVASGFE
ncbi:MAG: hypothetical protein R3E89_14525 [Thiolinea sp.]